MWLSLCCLLLLGLAAKASPPAVGELINNQASATYRNERIKTFETVRSNTVSLVLAAAPGLSLVANQTRPVLPGQSVVFPHTLTNTGNVALQATLSSANVRSDDFDLTGLKIYLDANSNGVLDPGEGELGQAQLLPGQSVSLLLLGYAPATVAFNLRTLSSLSASTADGLSVSVTDTALTAEAAGLSLSKSVSQERALPGDTLSYQLNLRNVGNLPAVPLPVQVDGSPQALVLARDALPANTVFQAITSTGGGLALYHLAGASLHDYLTTPPADLTQIDAIAFGYPSLASNGQQLPAFTLRLLPSAGGLVQNTAQGYDQQGGAERASASNTVSTRLPPAPAALDYYQADDYRSPANLAHAGSPLFLQAQAAACNLDPTVAETLPVRLSTERSGDLETSFVLTETAPNSGVFRLSEIPTRPYPQNPRIVNNTQMEVAQNDVVIASISCQGVNLSSRILIDPAGAVFDSHSGQLLAGASVNLIKINADGSESPASVLGFDGKPLSNVALTGADGLFHFPLVPAGQYRLLVTPPPGYRFVSTVPRALLPPGFNVADGSYGIAFTLSAATGAVLLDIPLDPQEDSKAGTVGFTLDKTVDRSSAQLGETLGYTLRVSNTGSVALTNVVITDQLPAGFEYLAQSARYNDLPSANPTGAPGPVLVFRLLGLAVGQQLHISYRVRVAATTPPGKATNSALANSDQGSSNTARASVQVDKDVFDNKAFILGKVFVDCDHNRVQDAEELGIPGVRLYLDDGTFAVSDAEGKYSFYGVSPRTHVLKIDAISLPPGSEMRTSGNRNGGDPHSLFIDLHKGELHRADFIEGSCAVDLIAQVKARRQQGEVFAGEISQPLNSQTNLDPLRLDPRTRPASGTLDASGSVGSYKPMLYDLIEPKQRPGLNATATRQPSSIALDAVLPTQLGNAFAFMDLADGDTLLSRDVRVRLLGPEGGRFLLTVNGQRLPDSRVGQKALMSSRQLQAWEYVSVRLNPGSNSLLAENVDDFGNTRDSKTINLIAPGELGKLALIVPPSGAVADGQTPSPLVLQVLDAQGHKIGARTPVTLETNLGRINASDLNPKEPGVQLFVEGGEAVVDFIPPASPGEARLRLSSGVVKTEQLLPLLPQLRPLIAAGLIEGAINWQRLSASQLAQPSDDDGFEQSLKDLTQGGDATQTGLRGSLFLKGKIKGNNLLTLAYDSDKDTRDRLFRDIEPERFYPVYGDSGIKGFDAQSSSPLYLRIDHGRSYMLYGDYSTGGGYQVDGGATSAQGLGGAAVLERRLANYSRSLTGLRGHVEGQRGNINLFAAYDRRRSQVKELPGTGTSGPYAISALNLLRNSEKVELLTRNRNQPSQIINSQTLTRLADYTLDTLDGSLLFNRAIPSLDENLNPISIRISYEVDSGGDRFWVYGADGQYRLSDRVELGASVAREQISGAANSLYGANLVFRISANSYAVLEAAISQKAGSGQGQAQRLEYVNHGPALEARVYATQTSETFYNPNAATAAGRTEAGFKADYRLNDQLKLGGEGLYSKAAGQNSSGDTQGLRAYGEYSFSPQYALELGARRVLSSGSGTTGSGFTSLSAKASWKPTFLDGKGSYYGEYEQDISNPDARLAALGGSYQLGARSRAYARHEFISSLSGAYQLSEGARQRNITVFGMDYGYLDNGSVFSEYRVRDALSGREGEAALGLRNSWQAGPVKLQASFEQVQPTQSRGQPSTAVAVGAEYLASPLTKLQGRVEVRSSRSERSLLNSVGLAHKYSLDWTGLAKNTVSVINRNGSRLLRDRLRLGAAYRDTDSNRLMWLTRYELRYDDDQAQQSRRQAQVLSSAANWHPARPFTLSGRYALKWVDEQNHDIASNSFGQLVSGRVMYDITEKIDLGLAASVTGDASFASARYGLGVEGGYLAASNLWLSLGYNWLGYSDEDLNDVDYTRAGPYARMRFKFDEDFFQWLE